MPSEDSNSNESVELNQTDTNKKNVDLDSQKDTNPVPKVYQFSKTKLIILSLITLGVVALVGFGGYYLGMSNTEEQVVAKKEEVKEKKEEIPDLVEVDLGEEATAKNGVAIKLEEAKIDETYEKQKEESKKAIEKNSSNSAYLESEYYKTSNLLVKVALRNTKDKDLSYSQADFRLKDSDDNQYTTSGAYEGQGSPTIYTLNPGETTKLNQAYIVPTDENSFTLIYQNVVISFSI